jgi:NAD(P)-dependent dehydrogenase (short-subunit alcohol dehydrogenase family)
MQGGTVVVTGSSTGICLALCMLLARRGARVVAGVRSESDAGRLRSLGPSVEPVQLDVTSDEDIERRVIRLEGEPVAGLVNNAGIAVPGPIETLTRDDWRRQFEFNLFGTVAVTRALIPRRVETAGRIVNVSSIAGFVAHPVLGPYTASKHALEAVSDVLRRELVGTGVTVGVVEPGDVVTPMWGKGVEAVADYEQRASSAERARYDGVVAAARARAATAQRSGISADQAAALIVGALDAEKPRTRYQGTREAKLFFKFRRVLPDRAMDALV